jgi:hypothetical protein
MDYYLIGRIVGVVLWPVAAAALVYVAGWLFGLTKRESTARYWVHVAAGLAYAVTLFVTGLHLLRYLRIIH